MLRSGLPESLPVSSSSRNNRSGLIMPITSTFATLRPPRNASVPVLPTRVALGKQFMEHMWSWKKQDICEACSDRMSLFAWYSRVRPHAAKFPATRSGRTTETIRVECDTRHSLRSTARMCQSCRSRGYFIPEMFRMVAATGSEADSRPHRFSSMGRSISARLSIA